MLDTQSQLNLRPPALRQQGKKGIELWEWIQQERTRSQLRVHPILLSRSREWKLNDQGAVTHRTGRFFRVVGVEYFDVHRQSRLQQPLIDQREIGTLCFLATKSAGSWEVLLQAKAEPGNVNGVQIAPSVQATESNYESVHGGQPVLYLDLAHRGEGSVLYHQCQSEQNTRFLAKLNINRVVRLDESVAPANCSYRWWPLKNLLALLGESHLINTDARSVLASWLLTEPEVLAQCLNRGDPLGLLESFESDETYHTADALCDWLDELQQVGNVSRQIVPLSQMQLPWVWNDGLLDSTDHAFFLQQIAVECQTREVTHWDQPIFASPRETKLIMVMGRIGGTLHLLLQARLDAGNGRGFELTTTVQAESPETQSYEETCYLHCLPTLSTPLLRFRNSEEGGRFDRCVSHYEIAWTDWPKQFPETAFHRWVSLSQVGHWLREANRVTNELRSAISALLSLI